jgi:hypothetical protein
MRPWPVNMIAIVLLAIVAVLVGGCGIQSNAAQRYAGGHATAGGHGGRGSTVAILRGRSSAPVVKRPSRVGPTWKPVASIGGRPAAWITRRSGVTLMRFEQGLVHLALHAGSGEPRGHGWTYGDRIGSGEIHRVVAAFIGGFKLGYGRVGFMADGRVAVPLTAGLGSIVTYGDGRTEIGAWQQGVPARGLPVASVLQNLHLLVDRGVLTPKATHCIVTCWGRTVGGRPRTARSALGITGDGRLV